MIVNSKRDISELVARASLTITSWNINDRIGDNHNKFDDPEFMKHLDSNIICLQETKSAVKVDNYTVYNNNRPDSRSGGVAIMFHNNIKPGICNVSTSHHDIACIVLDKNYFSLPCNLYIITVYMSPPFSSYSKRIQNYNVDLFSYLNELTMTCMNQGEVIICGDFNARIGHKLDYIPDFFSSSEHAGVISDYNDLIDHNQHERNTHDVSLNSLSQSLLDFVIGNKLSIANGRTLGDAFGNFTCYKWNGQSVVDYFICSNQIRSSQTTMLVKPLTSFSDHCQITLNINLDKQYYLTDTSLNFDNSPSRFVWTHESKQIFQLSLNNPDIVSRFSDLLNTSFPLSHDGCNSISNNFISIISDTCNESLKVANQHKKLPKKKWFDSSCKVSKRNLCKLSNKLSKHATNKDEGNITSSRLDYHKARNEHNRLIKRKRCSFLSRLNSSIENGHTINWTKFKHLKEEHKENISLDKHDLLAFYNYFYNLYSIDETLNTDINHSMSSENNNAPTNILNSSITYCEIELAVDRLKIGKSPSEDLITNDMIKCFNPQAIIALRKVFNHCLLTGSYPWHTSLITPLFKSGNAYNPDNYRAIAVGSCIGKLFSSILLERLTKFKDQHCPEPIEQLGFCKGAQTNDHILTLKTVIDKCTKRQKSPLFICFVDLRKAFDCVSRDFLLHKLDKLNITGHFFSVIKDMYSKSLAKIKIAKLLSLAIPVMRGTEQGHPLSPDLFKLFIRDLSSAFNSIGDYPYLNETLINHLLWADDLVLLALDQESLQKNIDILSKFCTDWGLSINIKKTKTVVFGKLHTDNKSPVLILNDTPIACVSNYCYLGITFNESGSFKTAQSELNKKALRATYSLRRTILKSCLSTKSIFKLFDTLIKPILLYSSQILAPHSTLISYLCTNNVYDAVKLMQKFATIGSESLHLKFLKWSLGVHCKASNIGCWGDTARIPLIIDGLKLAINYFYRVQDDVKPGTLLHEAFIEQKNLNLDWFNNITSCIKQFSVGKSTSTSKITSVRCFSNLRELFINQWNICLSESPKLDYYRTIKSSFCYESYLNLHNYDYRTSLAKFRISAHNLFIERGRYLKSPLLSREDRHCLFCRATTNQYHVESEEHALNICPLYSKFISRVNSNNLDMNIIFSNPSNQINLDVVAGRIAHFIISTNEQFISHYYNNHLLMNTSKCILI